MPHRNGNGANGDDERHDGLTRNERLVWDTLKGRDAPLKAYEILDQLKEKGVRAPMTVYRALEGLEEKGFIHKLEGLNSFMPCSHDHPHNVEIFLVCEKCGSASEVELDGIDTLLRPVLRKTGFHMKTARLETRGLCASCPDE